MANENSNQSIKILAIGDLHGQMPKIHYKDYDIVLAPGDFCSDGIREYIFKAAKDKDEEGGSLEWYEIIGKRNAKKEIKKSLRDGKKVLEKLNSLGKPVYIVPGNWDWVPDPDSDWKYLRKDHFSELKEDFENIINIDMALIEDENFQIIGYGESTGPEFPQTKENKEKYDKEELEFLKERYEELKKALGELFKERNKNKITIFLSHNVPFNTGVDKITDKNSFRCGENYGSIAAKDLIKKYSPELFIGGHMHEHFDEVKIGKTLIINSGFGSKCNTLITINKKKIKDIKLYPEKY